MRELMIDFITSLDGYASGEGWPGWWGLEGPEYLAWLGEQPPVTYLMGANTYRLMYGFAGGEMPAGIDEFPAEEEASVDELTRAPKVVFSASLEEPLAWANTTLVRGDAVQAPLAVASLPSATVSVVNGRGSWKLRAMPRWVRSCVSRPSTAWPLKRTLPVSSTATSSPTT